MNLSELEALGLTHNEAIIYIALLEIGETKTGAVVKRTGLHRVIIYDALELLIKKGLVSYVIKENIKYFQATNPSRIVDFLDEKKAAARLLLPELSLLYRGAATKQTVSIFEGLKGLKSAMNNMLEELSSRDYHYVFASGHMADTMGPYYTIYQNIKRKKKIMTHLLYDESFRARKDITKITYGIIKFYSLSYFPTDTWIYKNKVLIVTHIAQPPIAILIESQETANSYKKLFEGIWRIALK